MMEGRKLKRILIPVVSMSLSKSLQEFSNFMASCVGHDSRLKLLVTMPNYVSLTSSSSILADLLDIDCYICLYLLKMSKSLPDFGLFFNTVSSSFLNSALQYASVGSDAFSDLINCTQIIKAVTASVVNSPFFKRKIETMDANNMLQLINNVIRSKPSIKLYNMDTGILSLQILKAFLSSVTDNKIKLENLLIVVEDGTEHYCTYKGVILPSTERNDICNQLSNFGHWKEMKILIFVSLELSGVNCQNNFVSSIFMLLDIAINNGVKAFVCQKLVDEKVKCFLSRKKVILLERVGEGLIQSLEHLTSAIPLCGIDKLEIEDLMHMAGIITDIKLISCGFKKYILLQNNLSPVITLLVQSRMLGGQSEMKGVLKQCVNTLSSFLASPFSVQGAGYFEREFKYEVLNGMQKEKKMYPLMNSFCLSLLRASGSLHVFPPGKDSCTTSKSEAEEINYYKTLSLQYSNKDEANDISHVFFRESKCFDLTTENEDVFEENCRFDCYETKIGALYHVFDTVINMFEIGLIVKK